MVRTKSDRPVQVWSPLVLSSLNNKDFKLELMEAENMYDGERFIWFSPKYKKTITLEQDSFNHLLVPSKTINKITVYNIDEWGYISPALGSIKDFGDKPLYEEWQKNIPEVIRYNEPTVMQFPNITKKGIYFKNIIIEPEEIYIKDYKKSENILKGENPIYSDFGLKELTDPFLSENKHETFKIVWPSFFNPFFETGGGATAYYDFYWMKYYIKMLSDTTFKKEQIMQLIRNKVNTYTKDATSTILQSWLYPKSHDSKQLISELTFKFGVILKDMDEFETSKEVDNVANLKVNVKRIYSWLGYFWLELYNKLLEHNPVKFCSNCGQLFYGGRQDRIFCRKNENLTCWRKRAALRQKKKYDKNQKS